MARDTTKLVVGLLGAAGAVVLLFGLPAETSESTLGLVIVIGVWLVCGLPRSLLEVPLMEPEGSVVRGLKTAAATSLVDSAVVGRVACPRARPCHWVGEPSCDPRQREEP